MSGTIPRPKKKPANTRFSSGPCAKRSGWRQQALDVMALGRSRRSKLGKAKLNEGTALTREALQNSANFHIALFPGSDRGAL